MTKLWTVPAVLLMGGVFAVACAPAAEEGSKGVDEESVVSQLPLSAECSSCAGDSIGSACGDQLDACVASEHCLDVAGCFEGCEGNDAGCFATCAAASAAFDALVECVVCDACADSCQGEWECGGGGNEDGEGGEPCEDADDENCGEQPPECEDADPENCGEQPPECENGGDPDQNCELPPDEECTDEQQQNGECEQDPGDPECTEEEQQNGECEQDPPDPECGEDDPNCENGGENDVCLSCLHQVAEGECAEVVQACLENDGCNWAVECVHDCGDSVDCAEQCVQEGQNNELFQQALQCALCGPCADACPVDPWCG
jgi:hypothetical protein